MPNPEKTSRAAEKHQPDEIVCTRSGSYAPQLPETQTPLSRWIVRAEATLMVALAIAVLVHLRRPNPNETGPIKFAGSSSAISRIAAADLAAATTALASASDSSTSGADPSKGQVLFMQTCTSCHGQQAQGLPHMGVNLRDSKFVATTNDRKLVAFLKSGRKPTDAKNITGLLMPPRGGNVALDEDSLADIVAFLRQVQKEHADQAQRENAGKDAPPSPTADAPSAPSTRPVAEIESSKQAKIE